MSIVSRLVVMLGAAMTLILPTLVPLASAVDVPSTVEIEALTCGLELDPNSQTSLNYGTLLENEESVEQSIALDPTGNTDVNAMISGTDWTYNDPDIGDITVMLVGVTHYGNTPLNYANGLVLTGTPTSIGTIFYPFQAGFETTFKIKPVLETPGFSGTLTQQVTFTAEC